MELSFCSFVFGCNNPTYHPSAIRLFIILIVFFLSSKGAWHCFCLIFGCNNPSYYPSCFKEGRLTFLVLSFFGCDIATFYPLPDLVIQQVIFALSLGVMTLLITLVFLSKGLDIFVLSLGMTCPIITPVT